MQFVVAIAVHQSFEKTLMEFAEEFTVIVVVKLEAYSIEQAED